MKYEATDNRASRRRTLSIAIAITLVVIATGFVRQTAAQQLSPRNKLGRFVPQGSNDAANVLLRGGRDLISDEKWSMAEDMFKKYVSSYPTDKNIDAALYWMAYSQFKMSKFDQCKETVTRLLKSYQDTSWKTDAKTLLAQIPDNYGQNQKDKDKSNKDKSDKDKSDKDKSDKSDLIDMEDLADLAESLSERITREVEVEVANPLIRIAPRVRANGAMPDDDPCEFKIVVLQALFQSDVQRGIAAATDWLKPGSTQTVRCKGAALTLLARNGGKSVTPIILGVAQNESDLKLRTKAISVLGSTSDDSVIDPLRDFALNAQQQEVSEAALYALSQHTGARAATVLGEIAMSNKPTALRRTAILSIAGRPGEPAVDALLKIYDSTQDIEIRKAVISGLSRRGSERARVKLLEIARGADNIELRKAAINGIGRRGGEPAIDTLLGLYDSEKDEELRDQIINSIGGYSNDQRVMRKLIEIARNPQTPIARRRRAIGWLSRSKDPEVLKFLEDLLKQ